MFLFIFKYWRKMKMFRHHMKVLGYPLDRYSDLEILEVIMKNTKILTTLGIDPRYEEVVGHKLDEIYKSSYRR